jgi:hypothetical protein
MNGAKGYFSFLPFFSLVMGTFCMLFPYERSHFMSLTSLLLNIQGDSLMRILSVAAFAVSGYASTDGRSCKPFNPLLGETYEADYPDKGLRFFSEKVWL